MDETRIKVGTKIKVVRPSDSADTFKSYYGIGIGFISDETDFIAKGNLRDSQGYYWAKMPGSSFAITCIGNDFKVIKY